ncbi:transposase [Dictyobacter formicarum]|uniref:Transposase n=1 Tax=Dictyobacter formicarum TaxID=2778368 RepID=A0ABQ3VN80_9CHLR|nr:transposase [Dictyobacter formicarum]
MLARAFATGLPVNWVAGDTIYGYDELRLFLQGHQKNYVLAVPETHLVWIRGEPQPVGLLAALFPKASWVMLAAGEGGKGPRLYEWAWLQLPEETDIPSEKKHWVLLRRSLSDPSERAYYRVYAPANTPLAELVRIAGSRWRIEEGYEQAKGEVGLDQYEVRGYRAWYRHVTLALLAHAVLAVLRAQINAQEKKGEPSRHASR